MPVARERHLYVGRIFYPARCLGYIRDIGKKGQREKEREKEGKSKREKGKYASERVSPTDCDIAAVGYCFYLTLCKIQYVSFLFDLET